MKKTVFLSLIIIGAIFMACSTEAEKQPKAISSTNKAIEKVNTSKAIPAKATAAKPVITSMIQEEKQSIQIVDKSGKVKSIEIEQPKVASRKKATSPVKSTPKTTESKPIVKKSAPKPAEKIAQPKESKVPITQPEIKAVSEIKVVKTEIESPKTLPFSHDAWNDLLSKYVSSTGKVDYAGFKSNKSALDAYTKSLAANPIQASWSKGKKMAYWINAYNAFTVKLIVDNYPLSSITDLEGGKPWDKKWIKLGDKTYSLNNIENDILRPEYKDARIHFAVNCAAKSCPPLLNRAWTANNLEANFEKQAKAFVNNTNFNKIETNKVSISKIFEWYAGDFGDIITYLNKYANTKINPKAKVSYMEYNWALNK